MADIFPEIAGKTATVRQRPSPIRVGNVIWTHGTPNTVGEVVDPPATEEVVVPPVKGEVVDPPATVLNHDATDPDP